MKWCISLLAVLFTAVLAASDVLEDFQKAHALYKQRKYLEASNVFSQLAKKTTGMQKEQAQFYQSLSLGRAKKLSEALQVADIISTETLKNRARMEAYDENRKFNEIVREFAKEKIDSWPEEYRSRGHFLLGKALGLTSQYEAAMTELEKAVNTAGDNLYQKMEALSYISLLAMNRNDQAKVLDAAERAMIPELEKKFGRSAVYLRPVMNKTSVLIAGKKLDEARQLLDKLNRILGGRWHPGYWNCYYHTLLGDLEFASGETDKAKNAYLAAFETFPKSPMGMAAREKYNAIK
ncbi:MAG: hypothetical protein ACI4UV_18895 [Victivallales bacterium]